MDFPFSVVAQSKMGLSSKLLVILVVCAAFQAIHARPNFNIFRWTKLGYDVNKAADDAERDVKKELLNVKNKAWKETSKLIRKGGASEEMLECILKANEEFLSKADNSSTEATSCIEEVRGQVNEIKEDQLSYRELRYMKDEFKSMVKLCRNRSKDDLKTYQRVFAMTAVRCLHPKPDKGVPKENQDLI